MFDAIPVIVVAALFESLRLDAGVKEDKLVAVEGDITGMRLGLSDVDYATLVQHVSIVFHVAASVRFNEPLTEAIFKNTRATREVVNLCLQMRQLVALLHVSTTYSNCERRAVDEMIYPSPIDWRDAIHMAETLDPVVVNALATKYIGNKPNTYTFTKCLAEHVVWDHRHSLPVIIFRPSIVVSTWKDPVPGWLDNLNGPVGVMMGAGQGVLRVTMCDPDVVPDYMPVDIAIRAIIVAVYQKGTSRVLINLGKTLIKDVPLTDALWVHSDDVTTSKVYFTVKSWLVHLIPALIVDLILRLCQREPRLLKIQKKIFIAITALSYFTCQEWKFNNNKFINLLSQILPEDKEEFDFDFSDIDPKTYFKQCVLGARIYLLNDPVENIPKGRRRAERLYWIEKSMMIGTLLLVGWITDLPSRLQLACEALVLAVQTYILDI